LTSQRPFALDDGVDRAAGRRRGVAGARGWSASRCIRASRLDKHDGRHLERGADHPTTPDTSDDGPSFWEPPPLPPIIIHIIPPVISMMASHRSLFG